MIVTLKFAEKELKCSLGLMFLGALLDDLDMSLEEVAAKMQKNPFRLMPKMIFISAQTEAELNGEEFDLTFKDVVELLEKDGGIASPQAVNFINSWTASMTENVPKDDAAEEGEGKGKK